MGGKWIIVLLAVVLTACAPEVPATVVSTVIVLPTSSPQPTNEILATAELPTSAPAPTPTDVPTATSPVIEQATVVPVAAATAVPTEFPTMAPTATELPTAMPMATDMAVPTAQSTDVPEATATPPVSTPTALPVPTAAARPANPAAFTCKDGCAVAPDPSCNIKGNVNPQTGTKIYHTKGSRYYDKTDVKPAEGDRWFCTEAEAVAAGFRAPEQ